MPYFVTEILNDREKRTNKELGQMLTSAIPREIDINGSVVGNVDEVIRWLQRRKQAAA